MRVSYKILKTKNAFDIEQLEPNFEYTISGCYHAIDYTKIY